MQTCYRHPGRETGVSCSNCGNAICTDCMTATSVGMRCPDCAKQKTEVRTVRSLTTDPTATYVLIAINVLAAIGSGSLLGGGGRTAAFYDLALIGGGLDQSGPVGVSQGEYWRLITGGFLHGGLLHLLFNMWVLLFLGRELEPALGRARFLALYFTSLLAGSAGALLLQPDALTVGASGAVFGLMGAAFFLYRARGIDPMQAGIGPMILLNLGITFLIPNISIGGHIGGLIGGALAAVVMDRLAGRARRPWAPVAACAAIGLVAAVAGIAVAGRGSEAFAALLGLVA
jgi:membrane associated rhomboid family serine protease